jgi:fructosamine-3-kinase
VLEAADGFLALAWLEPGPLGPAGEEELGRTLAAVHRAGAPAFGAAPPGAPGGELRLGPLTFPAGTAERWPALHAAHHLAPLVPRAGLTAAGARAVAAVCERLEELAGPPEPPARLHGDLWSGNVHPSGGRAYLVDPAAYGGHREVDLAMLDLFGRMPARARAAYEEAHPLPAGHEDRVALWQLFPLLVHAVLFGGSYAAAAERAARRYV